MQYSETISTSNFWRNPCTLNIKNPEFPTFGVYWQNRPPVIHDVKENTPLPDSLRSAQKPPILVQEELGDLAIFIYAVDGEQISNGEATE